MFRDLFGENNQTKKLRILMNASFTLNKAMELIKAGANPNTKNDNGNSFLHILINHHAAHYDSRHYEYIKILVEVYKADINQKNARGMTSLQCFLHNSGFITEDVMLFVRLGADPDTKDSDGNSLLHILTHYNNIYNDSHNQDAINELITEYKADVNITNSAGETALECMLAHSEFLTNNAMQLVGLGGNPNSKNSHGESLLTLLKNRHHNDDAIHQLLTIYGATEQLSMKRP